MAQPFPSHFKDIADDMGISLYQKFSITEASLFLRCPEKDLQQIVKDAQIDCIQLSPKNTLFFGYQLLAYLLDNVTQNQTTAKNPPSISDRIIRAKEVYKMTGLSRTTLWRKEKSNEFPKRISLGGNSVGWKLSEIQRWIQTR